MIGQHVVRVAGVDISCLVDQVKIVHGRDNTTGQPEAPACTLDLSFTTPEADLPPEVEIGEDLHAVTVLDGTEHDRFVGTITDIVPGWEDAGENSPNAAIVQVVAVGRLASLGRTNVGAEPWPQELDGARVARILQAAGVAVSPGTSDPGTVQILARDVDKQKALQLAQNVARDGSGILWQTRGGSIRYADALHRYATAATLELDACDIGVSPAWRRDTAGLTNGVDIAYGVAPDGGEQPRYVAEDAASKDRYGDFDQPPLATELASLADAQALGQLKLVRNSKPVWVLERIPVLVEGLDLARTSTLLELDMHDLVTVTGMPVIGALPSSAALWVEGWTETLAFGYHDMELYVSGYCRTSPPPTWNNIDPAWTWDTLPPDLTWDGLACLGPPTSLGRWDDLPASLRWGDIPPETTWDTWKG